jgi:Ca2+-binding RTX toxin-like protein
MRWVVLSVTAALALVTVVSLTAANTVPSTKASDTNRAATPNTLKPAACSTITLTAKLTGSGTINGTNAAELITGSSAVDTIFGRQGSDCLLGGAANDTLNGGAGNDVCIGGPGTTNYNNCETQL